MSSLIYLARYEAAVMLRGGRRIVQALLFYAFMPLLFHFALGDALGGNAAIGVLWAAVLLSHLMAADGLFRDDVRDGMLAQLRMMPFGMMPVLLMRAAAIWLSVSLPMLMLSPILAMMMQAQPTWWLAATLLAGSPVILMVSMMGAALTASTTQRGALLLLICLPLLLPVPIFALSALSGSNHAGATSLRLLCGYALMMVPVTLFITSSALRCSEE